MSDTPAGQSQQVPRTEVLRPQNTKQETPSTPMPLRSGRILRAPDRFMFLGKTYDVIPEGQESDPCTYDEAINEIDADHWLGAMKEYQMK